MREQFFAIDPFDRRAIYGLRFTSRQTAEKEFQQHRALRISVSDAVKQLLHHDIYAKFFQKFADEALLKRLSNLALAAGKFPQSAKVRVRVTLRNKQFSGTEDESRADFNNPSRVVHRPMLL